MSCFSLYLVVDKTLNLHIMPYTNSLLYTCICSCSRILKSKMVDLPIHVDGLTSLQKSSSGQSEY